MRERKLVGPKFSEDSIGARCKELINSTETPWLPDTVAWSGGDGYVRTLTWARYPNRYWLEEKVAEKHTRFMGQKYLEHRLFEVAMLSALNLATERHIFKRWYILQSLDWRAEEVVYLENLVQSPEEELRTGDLHRTIEFTLENHLTAPNQMDMLALDSALALAEMDGATPLVR